MLRPFPEKALAKSFPGDFRESPPDPSKLYQAGRPATARARPVTKAGRAFGKVPRPPQSFIGPAALPRREPAPCPVRGDALSGKSPSPHKALSGRPPCHAARPTRARGAGTRFRESHPAPSKLYQAGRSATARARPVSKAVGKARRALQPGKFML